ncbi:MAG: hypothetical protein JW827_07265 [Spirochaetes bacterium]|nr:hypothetical protein [Spirochaetota bacterium]
MFKIILIMPLVLLVTKMEAAMYIPGTYNGWNLNSTSTMYATNSPPGYVKRIIQPANGSYFKLQKDNWLDQNGWSAGYWITGYNKTWDIPRNDQGNNTDAKFTNFLFANPYITVTSPANPSGTPERFGFLPTSSSPIKITSVTDNSAGQVIVTDPVQIKVKLSATKCSEERIYIRYTTDSWGSDNFVLTVLSNTTVYTASIPALNKICTVEYYILSTSTNWAFGNDLDNYPDLMSININNHSGANFSYDVSGIRLIDGDPSDWKGTSASVTNSSVISSNEWIWKDADNDIRLTLTYAGGTNNYELTEMRLTSDTNSLYILVRMKDLTNGYPYIALSIDTNLAPSSGQEYFGDLADTKVNTNAFWEKELVIPYADVRYYLKDWTRITNGVKSSSDYFDTIEAAISWNDLGLDPRNATLRFTVMVAQDSNGYTMERYQSDAMDCITPQPGETWNEVKESPDGVIDFFFDLDFNASCVIQPNNNSPASPDPAFPVSTRSGDYNPAFLWSRPVDADGDSVYFYVFQISEYSNFTTFFENKSVYGTNYAIETPLLANTLYYWRVQAYDEHGRQGLWSTVASFTSPAAFKIIDGDDDDWHGLSPDQVNIAVLSSNEWIFKDKNSDERGDFDTANLGNYDMTETRVTFDSNYIYLLFRYRDINDITKPYVAVSIDTDQNAGDTSMNWMADDSGILIGGDYGKANANSHYGEYNVIIHDVGLSVTKIELFTNSGSWFPPPTDGSDTCYIDPTDNLIEARIARQDVGLKGNKKARFSFAFCKNAVPPVWANSGDSTYTYPTCDAVDSLSISRFYTNDKYNDKSSWNEDISDGDIDFWVELDIRSDGKVTNLAPPSSSNPSPTNNATNVSLTPTLKWNRIIDGDDVITSYLLELSSVTNLNGTVLLRVNLTNTNYTLTESLPDGLSFYWRIRGRDRRGMTSPAAPVWSFQTIETQQVPSATTSPFSPFIDGIKDADWGTTPHGSSVQSNLPYNYAEDLYLSNDPNYLYIGWTMHKDPWDETSSGYDKSSHWGFVFESKHDPFGNEDDPFISGGTTKVSWDFKPDIWVEGWLKSDQATFGRLIKYIWNETKIGWDELDLQLNKDFAAPTNGWGEFRIPLKELGSLVDDKLGMIFYFRPAEDKPGVSDCVPFDPSANDYGDSASTLNSKLLYRIQYAGINTWHYPGREEVAGLGTMRNPVSVDSSDEVIITVGVFPYDGYDQAEVFYTTNNWSSTNVSVLKPYHKSGNNIYLRSSLGYFAKNKIVRYYTSVIRNGMITYNFGSENSTTTSNRQTARDNAFEFVVGNSPPLPPQDITLSPQYVFTNDVLTANITSATDKDGDPLICYFDWYKNDGFQSNFSSVDSVKPFQSKISNLRSGEKWHCVAYLYDGDQYSSSVASEKSVVLLNKWMDSVSLITNSSKFTNNEFIWYDRKNDVRNDVSLDHPDNFDLTEFHIKSDSTYLYFLFRFHDIIEDYRIGIAVALDTNQSGGTDEIGDEMGLTLGSNYHGSLDERLADVNLLFHSSLIGDTRVETKKAGELNWTVQSNTNACFLIHKTLDIAEARIKRSICHLGGDKKARFSLAVYKDYVGWANDVDSSVDFIGNGALDVMGIGLSSATNLINYAGGLSSREEELGDNRLDFYFDVDLDANNTVTNNPPATPGGFSPAHNATISDLTPTLSWSAAGGGDITGYYLEIGLSTNSWNIYRVNIKSNSFTVPENLPYGFTNYFWHVYARDLSGTLSSMASNIRFNVDVSSPNAGIVWDYLNKDNYNSYSGLEDGDGDVVFHWACSIDPTGISNYYICVGTSPGGTNILNDVQLAGNQTFYTAAGLARGQFYYAKIKAKNGLGVTGEYGPFSDGIYVSRITIDSNSSDWADKNLGANTTFISNGMGIWKDKVQDARNSYTNLDMEKFKIAFDYYNLYLYFKFTNSKPWADGEHFIQVSIDNDDYSSTRAFIGRGISSADLYVSSEVNWEYQIKILSGASYDTCYACDTSYGNWQKGIYNDNSSDRTIECAIPLSKIGGASRFLSQEINLSVAIFKNSSGSVEAIDGNATPDALDVIATNSDSWDSMSDQVLDYYLSCEITTNGEILALTGVEPGHTSVPSFPTTGADSAGWVQNSIIYFIFVDRFFNGDPSNDPTGDTKRKGGDFKGILDNLDYLRSLNINCIYIAPPMKFGAGGAAGYNTYDWWNVDEYFGTEAEFKNFVKVLKQNGIDLIIDWPGTAIGGGPIVDNNPDWAGIYNSPWGDWPEWTTGMAEVQQYFSDTLTHWSAKGVKGFRLDYAKFDGNPVDHGHQYWKYVRNRLKEKFPDRYLFGEIFDGAWKIGDYVKNGDELDGCFDFPLEEYGAGGIIKWAFYQSIDSGTFWSEIQNAQNTYGVNPIMVSFIDNHDKDRGLRRAGGDSWKMRLALGFTLTWHEPTSIFYGTEMGMDGYRIGTDLDNSPCIDPMWGLNPEYTPWWGGYNYTQYNFIKRLIAGKRSLPSLRSSNKTGGISVRYASGQWFIYERNFYNDPCLVILNRSSAGANAPRNDFTTWGSRTWRDWMHGSDYFSTGADSKFTSDIWVDGNDVRILVSREMGSGGFGECTIYGTVNVPEAIVKIKDYAGIIYERVTAADGNGHYTLNNVLCRDAGSEDRTVEVWAPGYNIQSLPVTVWDTGNHLLDVNLFVDASPPDSPKGLSIKAGDRLAELIWTKNTENDLASYLIYRSESENGPFTRIEEVLDGVFLDNSVDNDRTYYYKIRAKDINGNISAFSKTVKTTVGPILVNFWLNLSGSGYNNIETVLIKGNSEKMNFWGVLGDDLELENKGSGWWKISFELDQRLSLMYRFKLKDSGNWYEESVSTYYGNRFIDLADEGNRTMNIYHQWNSTGDPAPMRVQNFSVSPGNSIVSLSWDKNQENDTSYYRIFKAIILTGPYNTIASVNAGYNSYIDRNVINGNTYYYYITAIDENDQSSVNSVTNLAIPNINDSIPPSVPQSLALFASSTNTIKFTWKANNEADLAGYNVYRSNVGSIWTRINTVLVTPVSNPGYTDTVLAGTNYFYCATSVDSSTNANESDYSAYLTARLIKVQFQVDMGNITLSQVKIGGNKLPFDWNGLSMTKGSDYIWTLKTGLLHGDTIEYKYQYDSTYEDDFETWHKNRELNVFLTNEIEILIQDDWEQQPDTVEDVWVFPLDGKVEIHWKSITASDDLLGYNVYYSTNATSKFETRVNDEVITDTGFIVDGLVNNKTYYFVVRSIDSGAIQLESPDSDIVSVTPKKSVPVYFRTELSPDNDQYAFVSKKDNYTIKLQ